MSVSDFFRTMILGVIFGLFSVSLGSSQ